ncbi:MAG: hypothetical protein RQ756_07170, partial [Flavobacteriaceae bacterium]|nr:hypothetical protein [Flavobacteriaceae bacterium]
MLKLMLNFLGIACLVGMFWASFSLFDKDFELVYYKAPKQVTYGVLEQSELQPEQPTKDFRKEARNKVVYSPLQEQSFTAFKEALGLKESQGKYGVVNSYGYMGKYQFGKETLDLLGVRDTLNFLNSPILQEKAFEVNLSRNKWILRREIANFKGQEVGDIIVSESGILAAAHLAGPGNVKRFFKSEGKISKKDANGASVAYYMKKFAHFDTSKIPAIKNPKVV